MSKSLNLYISDEAEMVNLGAKLAIASGFEGIIFFNGGLGAGKTTLCRGIVQAAGHRGAVKSPTYTLVEPYELKGCNIYHFDLYRLGDPEELEFLGVRDYLSDGNLCLIEWPEQGAGFVPDCDLELNLDVELPGRHIEIVARNSRGEGMLDKLAVEYGVDAS